MSGRPEEKLAIAVAQLNSTVGDIADNVGKVRRARARAAAQGADLIVFPELFIAGYPPEDLVLKPAFQATCRSAVETLARESASAGPALLLGTPWLDGGKLKCERTIGMQTKGHAIEHQFILTANLIDVDGRQSLLGYPRHSDIETGVTLLPPVR